MERKLIREGREIRKPVRYTKFGHLGHTERVYHLECKRPKLKHAIEIADREELSGKSLRVEQRLELLRTLHELNDEFEKVMEMCATLDWWSELDHGPDEPNRWPEYYEMQAEYNDLDQKIRVFCSEHKLNRWKG